MPKKAVHKYWSYVYFIFFLLNAHDANDKTAELLKTPSLYICYYIESWYYYFYHYANNHRESGERKKTRKGEKSTYFFHAEACRLLPNCYKIAWNKHTHKYMMIIIIVYASSWRHCFKVHGEKSSKSVNGMNFKFFQCKWKSCRMFAMYVLYPILCLKTLWRTFIQNRYSAFMCLQCFVTFVEKKPKSSRKIM